MQYLRGSSAGGGLLRRLASHGHRRYVTSGEARLVCPLGDGDDPGEDPAAHPEPLTRFVTDRSTEVHASFEDILVVGKSFRLFVISPDRFPRRWKVLPPYGHLTNLEFPGPFCIGRWKEEILFLFCTGSTCLIYSFHTHSWITCYKPRHLFPAVASANSTRAAWFQGSFYLKCTVASEEEVEERRKTLSSKAEESDDEKDEEEDEPDVFSIMRFDAEERRWHELELSDDDVELLSSGLSVPLVVQGKLLVFSAAWGYLQSAPWMEQHYVCDEQADASWDGRSNPFKVFRLEDDPARDGWSSASVSRRKNMKKLVDVTRVEFGKLVDTAWERKAAKFFTGDGTGACGDDVLLWINFDGGVDRYNVLGDELLRGSGRFHWADTGEPYPNSAVLSTFLKLVHQDPGREDTVFSLFQSLPEINDSTSDEELREFVPTARFLPRQ